MKKRTARMVSLALTLALCATGCGKKSDEGKETSTTTDPTATESASTNTPAATESADASKTEGEQKYPEFLTIDVFANESNYEGIETGWFAKVVKDKFNMELNIISPNVSGGGDTLFTTRSAAGDLGDIVIIGCENDRLKDTVTAGLLYDMTDLVAGSETISQYTAAIDKVKGLVTDGRVYAIPKEVSSQSPAEPSETTDLGFGAFVRWDYYQELGCPELNTLEDLLPMMKQMQDAHPTSDSGNAAYAFSLFKDWDGNMMNLAQQPARFYGYNETGFVLHKVDGSDYDSIIDNDSIYVRGLKFFFNANQLGILDPESTTQNWDTLWNKYVDGAVMFSPWSWQGPSAYNTTANTEAGKGIKYVPIKDTQIISTGGSPAGVQVVIGIGSKAEDPQRMFDFIEWLYSPEGIMNNCSADSGAAGPEGLTWELVDGKCQLTEFGKEAFANPVTTAVPDEWGGGTWRDGVSALNYKAVKDSDINPETGVSYSYKMWDSYKDENTNPVDQSWSEKYGADTMIELVLKDNNYLVEAGTSFIPEGESSDITALRNQCKAKIVDYSWRMCFAKDEAEFDSLLKEMQDTVKSLGYDDVLAYDMQCAQGKDAARAEARDSAK
ncbi:MAG: extracellular solute-binding protein [Lachnospiraceae bacterium]|nr:extracellular solute-binding protein [Lachnospiraceae bacterium]